ncbi:MAG: permease-like cell division protein FtsX [Clostridiales bacterium]|nr:permease-like cell division protein FtsX [Clostridiales bacterium]
MHKGSLKYLTREGFRSVWVNRMMSVASVGVLISCLVIIGTAIMLFININSFLNLVGDQNVIMVFTDEKLDTNETNKIGTSIKEIENIKSVNYISREESWRKQIESLGDDAVVLQGIVENPLPNSYEVVVDDLTLFDQTVDSIKQIDGIVSVRENSQLAKQLASVRRVITWISFSIIGILFVVSLFIISNTIKVTMFARRLEINIMKSVGATNWFIRWPFMIEGVIIGFLSAIVSLGVVAGLYAILVKSFQNIVIMINAALVPFSKHILWMLLLFLFIGIATGVGGSFISMSKYLKEEGAEISEV